MKKIISAVLISAALSTSTFAYTSNEKPGSIVNKEIAINSAFQKINIGSNLQVVLVQDVNISSIVITGDESSVESINVSIDKDQLSISSKKNLKRKNIKIYVPVTTLTSTLNLVEVGRDASVTTEGVIMLDDLKVLVHDGGKVTVSVLGNFEIEAGEGCDIVFEKYEKSNVVFVKR